MQIDPHALVSSDAWAEPEGSRQALPPGDPGVRGRQAVHRPS
jgi:hypothetical protein